MRIAFFSVHKYDRAGFDRANEKFGHEPHYFEAPLHAATAPLAAGFEAICAFVNDKLDRETLAILAAGGTRLITLRCAGFNNVDLKAAAQNGLRVARVPTYSPYAVAEHALALILALNRKIHKAYNRVREGNFALDGLTGFDLHGKAIGVIGAGTTGAVFARMMLGLGCSVYAFDPEPNPELEAAGVRYSPLEQIYAQCDVISIHCPLTERTRHLINAAALESMRPGVMLINTSRGAIIDTRAAISALKQGRLGALGIDVYEQEEKLFFDDHSDDILQDDIIARLMTFPNVLITGHQAFFTREALEQIAEVTLSNVSAFEAGRKLENEVSVNG